MTEEYEVRRYLPEYRPRILDLQRHLWGSNRALNDAYFSWKYEQNPYASDIAIYLAFLGEQAVGMRGFFGGRWEAGANRETVPIWSADDLVVAPEHRNRGVFTRIMTSAFADLATDRSGFALNLGGQDLTVLGSLTMGWRSIGRLRPLGLPSRAYNRLHRWRERLSRARVIWRVASSRLLKLPSRFDRLDEWTGPRSNGPDTIRVSRYPDPEGMAALIQGLAYDGRIRQLRDARYFDWRFRNPLREYRFLFAGGFPLSGYLVLHRSLSDRDAASPIHLSDWEASSREVAERLLHAALEGGRFPSIVAWSAALPAWGTPLLEARGFRPVQQARTARGTNCGLVRPIQSGVPPAQWTAGGRSLLDEKSWDLRMLYSMTG